MELSGKAAIVTGGTGALGSVIVERIIREGASVAVPHRPGKKLTGGKDNLFYAPCDLSEEREVRDFVSAAEERFTQVDILVCAAGGYQGGEPLENVPVNQWHDMVGRNLTTTFMMTRAVVGGMKKRRAGRIVTVAAMAGLEPGARRLPYAISKAGVVALTKGLAAELKGTGVTVNAVAPGTILTAANRESMPGSDTSAWVPPEQIAGLIVWLCSPAGASTTGNIITVSGRP